MTYSLRVMQSGDLEPARWVIYLAYSRVLADLYGPAASSSYEIRSPAFMRTYLEREPEGCFVAEAEDGELVGVNFSFAWGTVGWFGSLAVHPDHQGRGLGQALSRAALDFLRRRQCSWLGLETWPGSEIVRHLYAKLGYRATFNTEKLARPLAPRQPPRNAWVGRWASRVGAAGGQQMVAAARWLADRVQPGLDFTSEIDVWTRAGMGDLFVLWPAESEQPLAPAACALCLMVRPSGMPHEHLDLRLLCVDPQLGASEAQALDAVLAAAERYAVTRGRRGLTLDVNLRYARARELLQRRGFYPVSQLIRMEQRDDGGALQDTADAILCARWAG